MSSVIGPFASLRPLRADVSGDPAFRELVRRVSRAASDAHDAPPSAEPAFLITFGVQEPVTTGFPGLVTSEEDVPRRGLRDST